jgi:hypothetical protein
MTVFSMNIWYYPAYWIYYYSCLHVQYTIISACLLNTQCDDFPADWIPVKSKYFIPLFTPAWRNWFLCFNSIDPTYQMIHLNHILHVHFWWSFCARKLRYKHEDVFLLGKKGAYVSCIFSEILLHAHYQEKWIQNSMKINLQFFIIFIIFPHEYTDTSHLNLGNHAA